MGKGKFDLVILEELYMIWGLLNESEDAQEGGWIVLQKQYKIKTLTQILLY